MNDALLKSYWKHLFMEKSCKKVAHLRLKISHCATNCTLLLSASWTIKTVGSWGAVLWPDKRHVKQSNRVFVEYVFIFKHKQVDLSYPVIHFFSQSQWKSSTVGSYNKPLKEQFYCCIILTRLCFNQQSPPPPFPRTSTVKSRLSALFTAGLAFASSGKCNWITNSEGMKEM